MYGIHRSTTSHNPGTSRISPQRRSGSNLSWSNQPARNRVYIGQLIIFNLAYIVVFIDHGGNELIEFVVV